jgi:forkhead transcription factor HCM1
MTSTRQPPPMQIFQDPIPPLPRNTATQKPKPQLQPSAMPLQPIKNLPNNRSVNIDPPHSATAHRSPSKVFHIPSPPLPGHAEFAYVSIPPPLSRNGYTDSLVKDQAVELMAPRPYIPPVSQRPLFTTFPSAPMESFDKENHHHIPAHNENYADFPDPSYARNRPLKRSLSDVSSFDRPFKRMRPDEEQLDYLPEPEDMPPVEDEGTKPSHSYANLIGMAILRAPNRRLTLAQIYKWISDSYVFYRGHETGWQNSIRHNLSLSKAFQKQERPKGDSGKGNYWTITPGMEMQFVKEKPTRKGTAVANLSVQPQIARQEAPPPPPPLLADALAPQQWLGQQLAKPQTAKPPTARPQTAPELPELSSDATLPASDPALQEDDGPCFDNNNGLSRQPESSPPQAINSSPPMPAPPRRRRETISPAQLAQPSSGRDRKRKAATMDDSGYFSSLESSVLRPNKSALVLTSELDVERPNKKKKRGRAEEAIARIRSSSHDLTPSHLRFKNLDSDDLMLSSPLRGVDYTTLAPTTPGMIFKKPARPPPSISPNTHLRNHRQQVHELVKSPSRILGAGLGDELAWSPYFKINNAPLDIYPDFGTAPSTPAMGSPTKRSIKRPSLNRTSSTPNNALQDITTTTNTRLNARTPSRGSMLKPSARYTPKSPSKIIDSLLLPNTDDFFNFGVFDDENLDELDDGVDILQGFQKIGGVVPPPQQLSPSKKATSRPALARSSTSLF